MTTLKSNAPKKWLISIMLSAVLMVATTGNTVSATAFTPALWVADIHLLEDESQIDSVFNVEADGMKVKYKGDAYLQFKDASANDVGDEIAQPEDANGIRVSWDQSTGRILSVTWIRNSADISTVEIPEGSAGLVFSTSNAIKWIFLTDNDEVIESIHNNPNGADAISLNIAGFD